MLRATDIEAADLSDVANGWVQQWRPVCTCGTITQAATSLTTAQPKLVAAAGAGTFAYVDAGVDSGLQHRILTFTNHYSSFLFDAADKGFVLSAVVRLHGNNKGVRSHLVSAVCAEHATRALSAR